MGSLIATSSEWFLQLRWVLSLFLSIDQQFSFIMHHPFIAALEHFLACILFSFWCCFHLFLKGQEPNFLSFLYFDHFQEFSFDSGLSTEFSYAWILIFLAYGLLLFSVAFQAFSNSLKLFVFQAEILFFLWTACLIFFVGAKRLVFDFFGWLVLEIFELQVLEIFPPFYLYSYFSSSFNTKKSQAQVFAHAELAYFLFWWKYPGSYFYFYY